MKGWTRHDLRQMPEPKVKVELDKGTIEQLAAIYSRVLNRHKQSRLKTRGQPAGLRKRPT